jgi:hypothetical protein
MSYTYIKVLSWRSAGKPEETPKKNRQDCRKYDVGLLTTGCGCKYRIEIEVGYNEWDLAVSSVLVEKYENKFFLIED